jgi:hypothetical protein
MRKVGQSYVSVYAITKLGPGPSHNSSIEHMNSDWVYDTVCKLRFIIVYKTLQDDTFITHILCGLSV